VSSYRAKHSSYRTSARMPSHQTRRYHSPSLPIQNLLSGHPSPPRLSHATESSSIRLSSLLPRRLFSLVFRPDFHRRRSTRRRLRALLLARRSTTSLLGHAQLHARVPTAPDTFFGQFSRPALDSSRLATVGFADAAQHSVYGVRLFPVVHAGRCVSSRSASMRLCCCQVRS